MAQAIMIRVQPEDFAVWRREHDGQRDARTAYGMTDGPVYRDETDAEAVLVTLLVEDMDRAREWFGSDAFKGAAQRAGSVSREIWFAEQPPR